MKQETREINMLEGSLIRGLFLFALPVALTVLLEQLINSADIFFLGHFVGAAEMAAVGNNVVVLSLVISLFAGLSLGTNVMIAYHIGAKNRKTAVRTVHSSFLFALLIGFVITIGGEIVATDALASLGVPWEVLPAAELYLRIYLLAMAPLSIYNFATAILRSNGDTRTPLYVLIAASLLNIALDFVAVSWLGLGIAGVAGTTVLSCFLAAGLSIRALRRAPGVLRLDGRQLVLRAEIIRPVLRIGMPAALQGMVFCIANIVIQSAINSLGSEVMAASAAAFTIEIAIYSVVLGFQQATTTFVSQNFGARNLPRCKDVVRTALSIVVLLMLALGALVYVSKEFLLALFTGDASVQAYGIIRLEYVVVPEVFCVFFDIFSGALRGYGESLRPAVLTLLAICGSRLTWICTVFPTHHDFQTIMLIYPISWILTSILIFALYKLYTRHLPAMLEKTIT